LTITTNETKLSPNIPGSNAKQHGARGNTASETNESNTKQRKTKLIKENTKQRKQSNTKQSKANQTTHSNAT